MGLIFDIYRMMNFCGFCKKSFALKCKKIAFESQNFCILVQKNKYSIVLSIACSAINYNILFETEKEPLLFK